MQQLGRSPCLFRIVMLQPAIPLLQPAIPLLQPAIPLLQPAIPLLQPAIPLLQPAIPESCCRIACSIDVRAHMHTLDGSGTSGPYCCLICLQHVQPALQ
jgi:hypothetical protein